MGDVCCDVFRFGIYVCWSGCFWLDWGEVMVNGVLVNCVYVDNCRWKDRCYIMKIIFVLGLVMLIW